MRPFTDVLRDMRKGRIVDELTEALATVVRGVMATDAPGEVTLKLIVKPQGKGDNAVIVSAKVSAKEPRDKLPDALFFADHEGALLRDDPTQQRIFADSEAPHDEEPARKRGRGALGDA